MENTSGYNAALLESGLRFSRNVHDMVCDITVNQIRDADPVGVGSFQSEGGRAVTVVVVVGDEISSDLLNFVKDIDHG